MSEIPMEKLTEMDPLQAAMAISDNEYCSTGNGAGKSIRKFTPLERQLASGILRIMVDIMRVMADVAAEKEAKI